FDVDELGVEGVPVVQYRREEVNRPRLVHACFHAFGAEQAPLDRADPDLGGAGVVRPQHKDAEEHHDNGDGQRAHGSSYFLISNSFMVCSRLSGFTALGPSLGSTTTSSPL